MATHRVLYIILLCIKLINCKVYERCELARELKFLHKLPIEHIPTWVCIVKHESLFNTSATNDGSGDHGLFQISDIYWCSPPGHGYACNSPCSAYEDDDISDDIACIKRIFNEHQLLSGDGFNAWVVYPRYCKGDVTHYIQGCFDNDIDNVIEHGNGIQANSTIIQTEEEDDDGDGYEFPALPSPPIFKINQTPTKISTIITTTTPKLQIKKFTTTKPKTTTLKPYFTTAKTSPFKHLLLSITATTTTTTTTTKPVATTTKRLTTLKPFSALLQHNNHNEYKRENKFGLHSEYTFVRTLNGAPILLSFPHLLYADQKYRSSVVGLKPNETRHGTFAVLQPMSGAPLKMAKRVQFNMFIRAVPDITILENVTNSLMPVLWIEESMTLSDDMVNMLKKLLLNKLKILEIIKWGLMGIGTITVFVSVLLIVYKL